MKSSSTSFYNSAGNMIHYVLHHGIFIFFLITMTLLMSMSTCTCSNHPFTRYSKNNSNSTSTSKCQTATKLQSSSSSSNSFLRRMQSNTTTTMTNSTPSSGTNNSNSTPSTSSISSSSYTIDPITIKGYKFFNSITKQNILIKGIDYFPRPNTGNLNANSIDFFTNQYKHIWSRDIKYFQELGINAIRLYSVDPNNDHSEFMCALANIGIYVLIELASGSCPTCAILSSSAPNCYPSDLKIRGEMIINEFSRYNNTLAFSAGNEVNHFVPLGEGPQWNAPCLKKFVRDMRAYMAKCDTNHMFEGHQQPHMRHIPIGLIMADSDRKDNTLYYNCQSNPYDPYDYAEWYGINTYVYCNGDANTFEEAKGFQDLSASFESYNYSIPVLLTEYGCLSRTFKTIDGYQGQRNFNQAKWLGMKSVQNDFAGGFAFEYSIEFANAQTPFPFKVFGEQNYGIGYFSPENCNDIDIPCEYIPTPSFYNLKDAYAQAHADESITLDTFEPMPNRVGRSVCPSNFPKLTDFSWKADWRMSTFCPKSQDTSVCSAISSTQPNSTATNNNNDDTAIGIFSLLWPLFQFTIIIGTIYILLTYFWKNQRIQTLVMNSLHYFDDNNGIKEVDSNSITADDYDDEGSGLLFNSNHDGLGGSSTTKAASYHSFAVPSSTS